MKPNNQNQFAQFAKGKQARKSGGDRKAVIYTRVSSYEQLTNTSLETQIRDCRAYAIKNGMEIVMEFGGTYESAKTDDERKEFKAMLTYLGRYKSITDVIVYDLSRFSRTGGNAIAIKDKLHERGVKVHAVTQPADADTPAGRMIQDVTLILAGMDNDMKRARTIAGTKARLNKGHYCGQAPVGYINTKVNGEKTIVPDPKRAKFIKLIFQWKANEGITNTEIKSRLRTRGWNVAKNTVSRIIQNPTYCGMLSHNLLEGKVIQGVWEPLVSSELFLKANGVNAKFIKGYKIQEENDAIPLKRFMLCGTCGQKLRGYLVKTKNGKPRPNPIPYYKCCTKGCSSNKSAKKLHSLFMVEIEKYTLPVDMVEPARRMLKKMIHEHEGEQVDALRQLRLSFAEVERKIERIEEKYLWDEITPAMYEKHRPKLDLQKAEIERELAQAEKEISNLEKFVNEGLDFAANLAVFWEKGGYKDRQRVQKIVFPEGMVFDAQNSKCLTPRVNEAIRLLAQIRADLEQKNTGKAGKNSGFPRSVPGEGLEPSQVLPQRCLRPSRLPIPPPGHKEPTTNKPSPPTSNPANPITISRQATRQRTTKI